MLRALALATLIICGASLAAAQDNPSVDAAMRGRVVEGVATQIAENFYDVAQGAEIAAEVRAALADGAYDDAGDAAALAEALSATLRPHDTHFSVMFTGPPEEYAGDGGAAHGAGDDSARGNYGFRGVTIMPGNVGVIDLREFADAQRGGETSIAALTFVRETDAVIFDLRANRGGAPSMVQLLISHFLDPNEPVAINTFLSSARDYPGELRSLSYLPAGARPDVPLFVVTSGATGSAGEAFPYHLQAMGRAVIVGETTIGAGNPGDLLYAGDGFGVFVSTDRSRNPITGTNWEGVGVAPDVEAPAEDALNVALVLAYDAILETAEDPARRTAVEWAREAAQNARDPVAFNVDDHADIIGSYGARSIFAENGALYYGREGRPPRRLTPLGEDRFMLEGLDEYRLVIRRGDDGGVQSFALEQPGAPPNVSPRSD